MYPTFFQDKFSPFIRVMYIEDHKRFYKRAFKILGHITEETQAYSNVIENQKITISIPIKTVSKR